jgi:hypothetical protein
MRQLGPALSPGFINPEYVFCGSEGKKARLAGAGRFKPQRDWESCEIPASQAAPPVLRLDAEQGQN